MPDIPALSPADVSSRLREAGFTIVPVSSLRFASWNYKPDDDDLLEKLKANLARNGELGIMNIRDSDEEDGAKEVFDGNHRLKAFQEMGKEYAIVKDHGKISLAAAQRMSIELNETRFQTDTLLLSPVMKNMLDEFTIEDMALTLPYSEEDIDRLSRITDFAWEQYGKAEKEDTATGGEGGDKTPGFEKVLRVQVNDEIEALWTRATERTERQLGYHSDTKTLEFALVEFLNTPEESTE